MVKLPNVQQLKKKTATLIQKIKSVTTLKLQKLSKRSESKNKKININHHHTIPHQQPYSLRPRPLPTTFSHNSIASSDHDSSSSSSFSSQNYSIISAQPAHQSISHSPQSNHPQQIIPNKSSQLYLLNIHRSQQIHIPHLKCYLLPTIQSPQAEVSNNSFTWMLKNNNNLTNHQSLKHLHLLLLHTSIHLIMHYISTQWTQPSPSQSQKYKFTNLLHKP